MSTEENVFGIFQLLCNFIGFVIDVIKSIFDVSRQHFKLIDDLSSDFFSCIKVLILCKPNGNESQHSYLTNKCFSTCHWEFPTTVQKYTASVFSGKSRIDFVNDVNSLLTMFFGKSEWNQKVHSFTRLRNTYETSTWFWEISWFNLTCIYCVGTLEAT